MVAWQSSGPVRTAITVSDAEGYTLRDDDGQRDLQNLMSSIENQAALNAGLNRRRAHVQGTGDGSHTTWPPETSEFDLITHYLRELRYELERVNGTLSERNQLRIRFSVCAGLAEVGPQGVTGQTAIRASHLVNNDQLRGALRSSPDHYLAVIIEDKLFEDIVMTRRRGLRPEDYRRVTVPDKYGNNHLAWISVPGSHWPGTQDPAHASSPASGPPSEGRHSQESLMSDAISVAADTLVALLAAGGGAVGAGAATEAGAGLYRSASHLAARIAGRLRGRPVSKETVTRALRDAVRDGELTLSEIERFNETAGGTDTKAKFSIGRVDGTVFVGEKIKIDRLNIGTRDE